MADNDGRKYKTPKSALMRTAIKSSRGYFRTDRSRAMNGEILLSHWWKTESCQRAFDRAAEKRRERIERLRQNLTEKQNRLQSEVETWEEKQI